MEILNNNLNETCQSNIVGYIKWIIYKILFYELSTDATWEFVLVF